MSVDPCTNNVTLADIDAVRLAGRIVIGSDENVYTAASQLRSLTSPGVVCPCKVET